MKSILVISLLLSFFNLAYAQNKAKIGDTVAYINGKSYVTGSDRIIIGEVVALLSGNKIEINTSGRSNNGITDEYSCEVESNSLGHRAGMRLVKSLGGSIGAAATILRVFGDKFLEVETDSGQKFVIKVSNNVHFEVNKTSQGIKKGMTVKDTEMRSGKVLHAYQNGFVEYEHLYEIDDDGDTRVASKIIVTNEIQLVKED